MEPCRLNELRQIAVSATPWLVMVAFRHPFPAKKSREAGGLPRLSGICFLSSVLLLSPNLGPKHLQNTQNETLQN